jgi:pyruvate dehydrogenase E2 component (dihydrolipoamide acetyltransferase)
LWKSINEVKEMEFELKMPDLATTKAEIEVKAWLVEVGQPVRRGQPLLEVETDKAVMEVESVVTGILKTVYAQPGDEIAAGQVIAIIEIKR